MADMEVVLDASVLVKWFVEEDASDKALMLRDKYIEGELVILAPELILYEVLNALYFKRLFSREELREISEALEAYSFSLYPLRGEYAAKALEVAFDNDITIYDASYIALAMIKDALVYTADERLIGRLKEEYLKYVKSIRELK